MPLFCTKNKQKLPFSDQLSTPIYEQPLKPKLVNFNEIFRKCRYDASVDWVIITFQSYELIRYKHFKYMKTCICKPNLA